MADSNKRDLIINSSKTVFIVLFLLSTVAIFRIGYLQTIDREKWQELLNNTKTNRSQRPIYATRGNIYAADGSILATTVPYYTISIDPQVADSAYFAKNIDKVCIGLSKIINEKTAGEYKGVILQARLAGNEHRKKIKLLQRQIKKINSKESADIAQVLVIKKQIKQIEEHIIIRYVPITQKQITHEQMLAIQKLPFSWENSKNRERGLIKDDILVRERPFGEMAKRTIGNDDSTGKYGLEIRFGKALHGKDGLGWRKKIGPKVWVPVDDSPYQQPENGMDVYSTLDMNFQDIAEDALQKIIGQANAENGSVVIMEIKTGDIKAMVNLGLDTVNNTYREIKNYAVKEALGDPGSTFKLATMMALIDNFNINLDDFAVNCTGSVTQGGRVLTCSHAHGSLTARQIFEHSCNVGTHTLVMRYFKNPDIFCNFLKKVKLGNRVISDFLLQEPLPLIKNRQTPSWSAISMSQMSIGYEINITPMQMITFYNMVANNGIWVKPRLAKAVVSKNEEINIKFEPTFERIELKSATTILKLKKLMEGVVERGTAKNVNEGICKIAGKTGTAMRLIHGVYTGKNQSVSFIGYFPADNPKYTCSVVMQGVKGNANTVSAPVFRAIADRVFAYDVTMHKPAAIIAHSKNLATNTKKGFSNDFQTLGKNLAMTIPNGKGIVAAKANETWDKVNFKTNKMPDLRGLSLRESLFILENQGFKVLYKGIGKVIQQSIEPGSTIVRKQNINLVLG